MSIMESDSESSSCGRSGLGYKDESDDDANECRDVDIIEDDNDSSSGSLSHLDENATAELTAMKTKFLKRADSYEAIYPSCRLYTN